MNISRRWFIGGAASFGAFQGCRFISSAAGRAGTPRLTFGVISDIHIIAENTDRRGQGNTRTLRRAFKWFDAQGADGVIIAGDMADAGLVSQLQCVADAWNDVFPGNRSRLDGRPVEKLFVYGNHDYEGFHYGYNIYNVPSNELVNDQILTFGMKKTWEEVFEEEYQPIYRKVVKGYSFVGAHWDPVNGSKWGSGPDITDFFAKHGREIDPALPFFYFQHPHPKDTCYGPWAWGHDSGISTKVLSDYANAIAFSGHSHYSLLDSRTVWQGAFTSFGTGSLRYAGGPYDEFPDDGGYENTSGGRSKSGRTNEDKMMPGVNTGAARNGMLFTVYDDHIAVTRRDFLWDADLGPDWVMPLPAAESKPFAFAEHAKKSVAPAFPADAKLTVTRRAAETRKKVSLPSLVLAFPAAAQTFENRVWRYDVVAEDKQGQQVLVRRVLSPDYHLPLEKAVASVELPIALRDLPLGSSVRFTVTPVESLGKAGAPIVSEYVEV